MERKLLTMRTCRNLTESLLQLSALELDLLGVSLRESHLTSALPTA